MVQGQPSVSRFVPESSDVPHGNSSISNPTFKPIKNSVIPHDTDLDIPVAIRKGVLSCTPHPVAKYLSYHRLFINYKAFTSKVSHLFIPKIIEEALGHPQWKVAAMEQMRTLNNNRTREINDLAEGKKTVGCKWVFHY